MIRSNRIRIEFELIRFVKYSIRFDSNSTNHVILCQLFPFLDYELHKFPTKKNKKIKKYIFMERLSPKKEMIFIKSRDRIVESNQIESSQIRIRFDNSKISN